MRIYLESDEPYEVLRNRYGSVSAQKIKKQKRLSILIRILNIFSYPGTWNWAMKQMLNGSIVTTKDSVSVEYRLSQDGQARLQNRFGKQDEWSNSNFFYAYLTDSSWMIVK